MTASSFGCSRWRHEKAWQGRWIRQRFRVKEGRIRVWGSLLATVFWLLLFLGGGMAGQPESGARLSWATNLLTFHDARLPGGKLEVWYLEAFLRPGAHDRDWNETRLTHHTELLHATPDGQELRFRTRVEPSVVVLHEVRVEPDGLDLRFLLSNEGTNLVPVQWFQPACIRVAQFTGCGQSNYTRRSFVFTTKGRKTLDRIRRTGKARYLGGQVYLPPWTAEADANPRPISPDRLGSGLIGCVSGDGKWILATASDQTHELFEGVYVCLHSDPLVGGLKPGESKRLRQKLYLVPNDPEDLVRRYRRDFPIQSMTER